MNHLVGIQGKPGSFHEEALFQMGGDISAAVNAATFAELYGALRQGNLGSAVVAIANNRFGPIPESMNELLSGDFVVTGETYVAVKHQLLGVEGATLAGIREVHSQAPALGQCGIFLHSTAMPRDFQRVEQEDTAGSAELIASLQDPSKVAIASRRAGALNGLVTLRADIQDDPDNITRFLMVERKNGQSHDPEADKTTITLKTGQAPGSLADALQPFKAAGVNIENLHSSYIPNSAFDMKFFVEFDAGEQDQRTQTVYEELGRLGCTIERLGSYRRAEIPATSTGNSHE